MSMREIRNSDGKLIGKINEINGALELFIKLKDCMTLIVFSVDGKLSIINTKITA